MQSLVNFLAVTKVIISLILFLVMTYIVFDIIFHPEDLGQWISTLINSIKN